MQATATYMPPPMQQASPILSLPHMARAAGGHEQGSHLAGAVELANQAAASIPSLLLPLATSSAQQAATGQGHERRPPTAPRQQALPLRPQPASTTSSQASSPRGQAQPSAAPASARCLSFPGHLLQPSTCQD